MALGDVNGTETLILNQLLVNTTALGSEERLVPENVVATVHVPMSLDQEVRGLFTCFYFKSSFHFQGLCHGNELAESTSTNAGDTLSPQMIKQLMSLWNSQKSNGRKGTKRNVSGKLFHRFLRVPIIVFQGFHATG